MRRYLDVSAVAGRYCVSSWTVYQWASSGQLPHRKIGGKLRFLEEELDRHDDGAELEVRKTRGGGRAVIPVSPEVTGPARRAARR